MSCLILVLRDKACGSAAMLVLSELTSFKALAVAGVPSALLRKVVFTIPLALQDT